MGLRIGIDCDGVLRDLIPAIQESVKETHPHYADKMKVPTDWGWESWLPFWTEDETEKYVFEDNYLDFFGIDCPAINSSVDDWVKLKRWAEDNGHELVLVSAQRDHCKEPTDDWLKAWGFDFKEKHYTKHKWAVDVDILIDDSPEKLKDFKDKSVNNGTAVCMKHTYNTECHEDYICIDNLIEIKDKVK
jgi:5'(3')-deoxyribonucleotidase